jgi:HEAT repeat protein
MPDRPSLPIADAALTSALVELRSGDFQSRWDAAKRIASFGEGAIAPLLDLLQESDPDDDWELPWFIARILGELDHPAALHALVELVRTTDNPEVAGMAATALGGMGVKAIAPLCTLLDQDSTSALAIQALTQIRHPDIIPPLLATVRNAPPALQASTITTLSNFHHPDISELLLNACHSPIASVRQAAVIALGLQADQHNKAELVQHLRPLLWDLNLEVCQQTTIALGRIKTPEAVTTLLEVLRSPHTPMALQVESIRSLIWSGSPIALNGLADFLDADPDPIAYSEALAVLGRVESAAKAQSAAILIRLLDRPIAQSPRDKQTIALSLGQLEQTQAIDPLIQLLADENASVRFHAIAALKQLAPQVAYERLQVLAVSDQENEALKRGVAIALQEWDL